MNLGFYKEKEGLKWIYPFFPLLLIVGFILRILFSPSWTYEGDFGSWKGWAYGISKVGFSEFYDEYWCDYMPGYLYILWLLQHLHTAFPMIPDTILFKLPANLSDLGISIVIFYVLRNITNVRNAKIASLAYFFNPASLSNSTFWGQVDSVHTLPLLVSIFLGVRRHFVISIVFAVIAFMIKPQSIVIFPIIGFFVIRDVIRRKKEDRLFLKTFILGVKIFATSIITIIVITLPFFWDEIAKDSLTGIIIEPIFFIKERFFMAYNQYKYTSLNAFNFWAMIHGMWISDQDMFLDITYKRWGTIIFGAFYALIFGFLFLSEVMRRSEAGFKNFEYIKSENAYGMTADGLLTFRTFHVVTLILFALFLFVTRAHERHFLPTIVFFTMIVFRSRLYWLFYALISLVYVINMAYAYIERYPIHSFSSSIIEVCIPGMVIMLLFVFLVVLADFIKNSLSLYKGEVIKER